MTAQFMTGKMKWCKLFGEPRMDELAGRKMWAFDFYPDDPAEVAKMIKSQKVNKTLKDKGEGKYLGLSRNEFTTKGEKMKPIPVYGPDNEPWDQSVDIGNDSKVMVKYHINEGSKYGNLLWVDAVKVLEHIPYEKADAFPKTVDSSDWVDDDADFA